VGRDRSLGRGEQVKTSPAEAVAAKYKEGKTDEFMPPLIFCGMLVNKRVALMTIVVFVFSISVPIVPVNFPQAFLFEKFDGFDRGGLAARPFRDRLTQYDVDLSVTLYFSRPKIWKHILGEGRQCRRQDAVTHCGNGKISARHLFF